MTTITLDIPEAKAEQYTMAFSTMAREYSIDDIEDFLLALHMQKNDSVSQPISELRAKYAS